MSQFMSIFGIFIDKCGSRAIFLIPIQIRIRGQPSGTISKFGFRWHEFSNVFSYIKIECRSILQEINENNN